MALCAVLAEHPILCPSRSYPILTVFFVLSIKHTNSTNAATAANWPRRREHTHVGYLPKVFTANRPIWYTYKYHLVGGAHV
jgi:hypothetical protein